jgi:hypothetical protein
MVRFKKSVRGEKRRSVQIQGLRAFAQSLRMGLGADFLKIFDIASLTSRKIEAISIKMVAVLAINCPETGNGRPTISPEHIVLRYPASTLELSVTEFPCKAPCIYSENALKETALTRGKHGRTHLTSSVRRRQRDAFGLRDVHQRVFE